MSFRIQTDYAAAQDEFTQLARATGQHSRYAISGTGAHDSQTVPAIDVAFLGCQESSNALIVSSGVHGVEGPVGSAVQLNWLRELTTFERNLKVVLIHAVNPWGWIHARRWDENGVDLNRNFFEPPQASSAPDGYSRWLKWLMPTEAEKEIVFGTTPEKLGKDIKDEIGLSWGKIIPVGQYQYPEGLFFGGSTNSAATKTIQANLADWIGSASSVVHLDIHSGLGKFAAAQFLVEEKEVSPAADLLKKIFGFSFSFSENQSYPTAGSWENWCKRAFSTRRYFFITIEFGTYSIDHMLGTLVRENYAWHFLNANDPVRVAISQELCDAYVCPDDAWQFSVIKDGTQFLQEAIDCIAPCSKSSASERPAS